MAKPPIIQVVHLQKSFKKVPVLQDVTFEVARGSVFALLGPNGAGKTTTINILTTLLPSDGGTATIDGLDVAHRSGEVRRRISLTGQFAAIDEVLTGRENLVLIARLRHTASPKQVASDLLKRFDLTDAADRPAGTYSGGMRRRLDIAMSLIGKPQIIFLDEPTTGLDPQSRNLMWGIIRSLAAQGVTIFLTTQYLDEADQLADTIAVLSQGKIVALGTPTELKKLVPAGQIELRFRDRDQLQAAIKALARFQILPNEDQLVLAVTTDGSVNRLIEVINHIKTAHLEVLEVVQKTPTLDDAFLKLTQKA